MHDPLTLPRRNRPDASVSAGTVARWARPVAFAVLVGFTLSQLIAVAREPYFGYGLDYRTYMERAQSWLAGDGFYLPSQLAGPYPVVGGEAMYPPVALVLFVPFTVLPWVLWWAVPLAILGLALWRIRPSAAAMWILLLLVAYPRTWVALLLGNPSMWAFAALAAGLAWGWGGAFAAFKPTLGPFAVWGANRRSWWIGAVIFALLCVPFGAMWLDYLAAMTNAQPTAEFGLGYVLGEWPIAAGLIAVAWLSPWTRS